MLQNGAIEKVNKTCNNEVDKHIEDKLIISIPSLKKPMSSKIHSFLYKKNRQQQIRGFYHAARLQSISKAAQIMNLTQSTVTLQVQSLEKDLGYSLLKRDSKPLILTTEGEMFYQLACPLMQQFESVVEKFLSYKKHREQKIINIAAHHISISYLMPQIIADFKKSHPKITIIIRNIAQDEAIKRLKDETIDLAFYPWMKREVGIREIKTISYDPVLIIRKNHPLKTETIKNLRDLKKFDLIRIDKKLITLNLFEEAIKSYNVKSSVEFENGSWEMLKAFVKKNDFAAVVSQICIDKNDKDFAVKNLSQFFPQMSYRILLKDGKLLQPAVQKFVDVIYETTLAS
ncbi:MAG: hypothetical protein A2887_04110 [Alphaproteobacteria bacterium RIFCSPLOWO2_01_FULL_40_26]|nr:MAG: hypothetical protein A3D15_01895 [Alphaproteobacteria bacterium RIFCSPHIGHO2_02_FULL_40_34]OFW86872.1 MAG: hypothetical protein A2794_03935 [Alphaproteobacteria bacterium RIFCSPHIGHO2_01_FULL_40_8]OFW93921.1 MAG: hypothetical protein A2887_04110 [Alphaproteobacteria bacterium RIFCSPLOWO2_01_FULL_40_26]OFX09415.1 MAG: hypothetical protein A3H30_01725 [Alphaproteobacteria bacterium RIFCSPLOWO2_02_FULL_40_19]OFX11968.1 MAG: hypothetical protein A3G22_05290 [Alphaproteobacteria bacterium RI